MLTLDGIADELVYPSGLAGAVGAFIKNPRRWTVEQNRLCFVSLDFELTKFKQEFFNELDIHLPEKLAGAVDKRKAEFLAGRFAAREALIASGLHLAENFDIEVGESREPIWPLGFVGSITHNSNQAVCMLGRTRDLQFVGVDIEHVLSNETSKSIAGQIHSKDEQTILTECGFPANVATTLIFSAKESLFKAVYPRVKTYFGFEKARVVGIDREQQCIYLELSGPFATRHGLPSIYRVGYQNFQSDILTSLYL